MVETPGTAPPPRRSGLSAFALVLVGAVLGGVAGGLVGSSVAERGALPPPVAEATPAPGRVVEIGAYVDAVREVLPAVVTVINKLPSGQPQSSGSGVIVDKDRGFIVTNSHVVEEPRTTRPSQNFDVVLFDGTKLAASVVGNDSATDVAVLRVQGRLPAQARLGDSASIPLGTPVVAIGSPGSALGLFQNTVTSGIVSAKGRRLPRGDLQDIFLEDLIQTDAAINPGNSGGPLVRVSTSEVIGLNTLVVRTRGEEGLGFAIPSNTVRRISDELIAKGRVVRGFIGISYDDNSPRYAALSTSKGVVVLEVAPGSPAAAAGLRPRDVITKINDQEIDEGRPLRTLLLNFRPGDRVILILIRDGREQAITITLGAPSSDADHA